MTSKEIIKEILVKADVEINGLQPWDIQVHNDKFYDRVLADGTLGLGESYMDGWWDCEALDELINRIVRSGQQKVVQKNFTLALQFLKSKIINVQSKSRSKKVAEEHYDLGNDMYMAFLDPYNQYTCGYFKNTDDLNRAQEQKLDLICKKIQLKSTDKVLDIGCGWGGFAKWAADHYGCHVTGISISDEQIKYANDFTEGLHVEIIKSDYRDITGTFDKIVSVGMIEHVGYRNYKTLMEVVKRNLAQNGLFLLHTIGRNTAGTGIDPWIEKYIFPNSMIPSLSQLTSASEGLFVMEDLHNFGAYYDKTLLSWWKNFDREWPRFKEEYGERFYRMFRFYMLFCAGGFRARDLQLWQFVFSPRGTDGGYESIR